MEDYEIAQESGTNENPFVLFAASLDLNLDAEVRINSIKKLTVVALALGVEKTKTDLISYLNNLTEVIYNDDELLMHLAEQLQKFLPFVGGPDNVGLILNILEKLCAVEEFAVRQKAVEALEYLCNQLDDENIENNIVPLVFRLIQSDWFTSKCSAAALSPICYARGNKDTKAQFRNIYKMLCLNDAPLVRRAAAITLNEFIRVLENDMDSVRLLAIDVGISLSWRLTSGEIEELIVGSIIELSEDASWRVRYQAAKQLTSIQKAFGHDLTQRYLISICQHLVHDTEPQVREACANVIVRFCEILQETYKYIGGKEAINPVIFNQIFPMIKILYQDCNSDVKEALSGVITSLSPLFGLENTKLLLLPLITASLLNESSKIRENIISNLNNIISVIGIEEIADTVLKIITDLVNSSASIWRTRRNLIVTVNYIAKHSGRQYFDVHLRPLYQKLLSDGVYAVRKTAPLILPILIKQFGFKWARDSILTDVLLLANHSHYLYRYVYLFCIDELVSPTIETNFKSMTEINQLKYLAHIYNTESGNDKIASFLNRIKTLNTSLQMKFKEDWVFDVLTHLHDNDIPNDNIKLYTEDAIDMFIKDNNLNITCTTIDEINNEDVYLEGLLDVVVNTFMDVLCQLSTDRVDNVQSLVGKTLINIEKFSNALEKELNTLHLNCVNENENIYEEIYEVKNTENVYEDTDEVKNTENIYENISEVKNTENHIEQKAENGNKKSLENELLEILEDKLKSTE
ncbi:hypothetical protein RN001_012642 [Aquatica leii]|uniref:Phosphatase PP2A regulatory subunit A/Splicing factor 3B subunit 1-like HEAT repeat domain-containing protein n=1 Tax=Aquatica leii TaxID=1421715 RepID=A0AAN7NYP7_9COLE|nr:hypothetical protein RN001_012642 [Aquatica leii]